MNNPIHILNKMGVLSSFSVAKKITEEELNKYISKEKKSGKSTKKIGEILKQKIMDEIQNAIVENKVPGLISDENTKLELLLGKNIIELNRMGLIVASKMTEKNYDKMSLCYFINALTNMLGLQEEDFIKFHRRNNDDDDGDLSELND